MGQLFLPEYGYLTFISLDQFNKNTAHLNYLRVFLFYINVLYKLEFSIPAFQKRIVSVFLNIISLGIPPQYRRHPS
jgi:hypothetical protein